MVELVIVEDTITPRLNLVSEHLADCTVPLTEIMTDGLFSAQQQVFEGKGSMFGGAAWVPMAESTIKSGRDPATLLVDTGQLLASLGVGAAGNFMTVGPSEGTAGTDVLYAGYQQHGTKHIPPRPFLEWFDERVPIYQQSLENWILYGETGSHG